ncbi:MAG: hypothetical protein Q9183_000361 [Haloplaca sp. 2 TL-2023]
MSLLNDAPIQSSIKTHRISKARILGFTAIVLLIFFISLRYQVSHFDGLDNYQVASNGTNAAITPLKAAVIVEGRPTPNLVPLILHFSSVLGPEWPIKVLHTEDNRRLFSASPAFTRQLLSGHITLQLLPTNITLTDHEAISKFFTARWFWDQLAPYKHILTFQADSILCSNSPHTVDEFLQYDFIGAPIRPIFGHGMNGGLSLRNRDKMLEVLDHFNFTGGSSKETRPEDRYEDQWFVRNLDRLPLGPHGEPGANIPSQEVASNFSTESIWQPKPFGLHQILKFQKNHLEELEAWCPEYRLAGAPAFHPTTGL